MFVFLRVPTYHKQVICKKNWWKIPEHILTDVYIFLLFSLECMLEIQLYFSLDIIEKKMEMYEKSNF